MSDFCLKEGFNCKYCEESECVFYSMGSGQMIDMPCFDYDEESITDVLDKIRAEIMILQTYKMFEGENTVYVERDDVLALIDKYKTEREE